jgi:hypothetical protein
MLSTPEFGYRVSSIGIATRYGLDGPGFETRSGKWDFCYPQDWPRGSSIPLYKGYRLSLPG